MLSRIYWLRLPSFMATRKTGKLGKYSLLYSCREIIFFFQGNHIAFTILHDNLAVRKVRSAAPSRSSAPDLSRSCLHIWGGCDLWRASISAEGLQDGSRGNEEGENNAKKRCLLRCRSGQGRRRRSAVLNCRHEFEEDPPPRPPSSPPSPPPPPTVGANRSSYGMSSKFGLTRQKHLDSMRGIGGSGPPAHQLLR